MLYFSTDWITSGSGQICSVRKTFSINWTSWISCSGCSICMSVHSRAAGDGCSWNIKWAPSEIQSICVRRLYGMMCFAREGERKARGGRRKTDQKKKKGIRRKSMKCQSISLCHDPVTVCWHFLDRGPWTQKGGNEKETKKECSLLFDGWRGLLLHLDGVQLWQAAKYTQTSCLASERPNRTP